jgi:hypothetical protein
LRGRKSFLKLLSRVDPNAHDGFGFEGKLFRPGARVEPAELRPTSDYPEIPVILEYSIAPASGIKGNRRAPGLYVLWCWRAEAEQWHEIGRASSYSWEWAIDLRPLAIRALSQARAGARDAENSTDLAAIADSLTLFVDKQLDHLQPAERAMVIGILHDHFAARFCA